jgi:hypothetical protein
MISKAMLMDLRRKHQDYLNECSYQYYPLESFRNSHASQMIKDSKAILAQIEIELLSIDSDQKKEVTYGKLPAPA